MTDESVTVTHEDGEAVIRFPCDDRRRAQRAGRAVAECLSDGEPRLPEGHYITADGHVCESLRINGFVYHIPQEPYRDPDYPTVVDDWMQDGELHLRMSDDVEYAIPVKAVDKGGDE
mgnify:CR=1 FL=1|jgi:hypothetical protein